MFFYFGNLVLPATQKPENVLMRSNGHIALTDFDLSKEGKPVSARVVSQHRSLMKRMTMRRPSGSATGSRSMLDLVESEPELRTTSTSFVGTAEYLSPEIIAGVEQTSAVDWWTLGVLIYEVRNRAWWTLTCAHCAQWLQVHSRFRLRGARCLLLVTDVPCTLKMCRLLNCFWWPCIHPVL